MIKLNDSFGIDERLSAINQSIDDEHRKLMIIEKALGLANVALSKRIDSLNKRASETQTAVYELRSKL
ncbi:hypothetical protein [Shewanella aestuarii]|uniref:Uncharacterized protein n=1 Tax=Shewanella aestuarii TaxID=1028752 RepID=A0A6G9QPN7_9GAMM|nr:hypothetical protein [Shewanella aestuarii]QIR16554.1 hypothetical protein HBH39_18945 [Shewanella aestuarii]